MSDEKLGAFVSAKVDADWFNQEFLKIVRLAAEHALTLDYDEFVRFMGWDEESRPRV